MLNLVVERFIKVNFSEEIETLLGEGANIQIKSSRYITNLKKNHFDCFITIGNLSEEELKDTLTVLDDYIADTIKYSSEFLGFGKKIVVSTTIGS